MIFPGPTYEALTDAEKVAWHMGEQARAMNLRRQSRAWAVGAPRGEIERHSLVARMINWRLTSAQERVL